MEPHIKKFLRTYLNPILYNDNYGYANKLLTNDAYIFFHYLDEEDGLNVRKYVRTAIIDICHLPTIVDSSTLKIEESLIHRAITAYKNDKYDDYRLDSLLKITSEYIRDNLDFYKGKLKLLPTELYEKLIPRQKKISDVSDEEDDEFTKLDIFSLDDDNIYFKEFTHQLLLKKVDGCYYAKSIILLEDRSFRSLNDEERQFCQDSGIGIDETPEGDMSYLFD